MKVQARSKLGRTLIAEHGNEWEEERSIVDAYGETWTLLRSVSTGYLEWMNDWYDEDWYIMEMNNAG